VKKALVILLVIVAAVAGVVFYVLGNLDSIVKNAIESNGSAAVGTAVKVGSVNIALAEGRATISELTVANPPGFSAKPALRFGKVSVEIDPKTVSIKRIYAGEPQINVEVKGSENNFSVLQKNINAASGGKKDTKPSESESVTVTIDTVEIDKARATLTSDQRDKPLEVTIDRLQFSHLKGTPDKIAAQLAEQIIGKVVAATATELIKLQVEKKLGVEGGGLGDKLKGALDKLRK